MARGDLLPDEMVLEVGHAVCNKDIYVREPPVACSLSLIVTAAGKEVEGWTG